MAIIGVKEQQRRAFREANQKSAKLPKPSVAELRKAIAKVPVKRAPRAKRGK